MDFLASLLGSMGFIWILTRIIYLLTFKMNNKKNQTVLAFIIGALFITSLIILGWYSFEFAISYYIALVLWFILDFKGITKKFVVFITK